MFSEDEVSLFYKKVEKSEEKFLEEVTTALVYGYIRGYGVYNKNILHIMLVYTI